MITSKYASDRPGCTDNIRILDVSVTVDDFARRVANAPQYTEVAEVAALALARELHLKGFVVEKIVHWPDNTRTHNYSVSVISPKAGPEWPKTMVVNAYDLGFERGKSDGAEAIKSANERREAMRDAAVEKMTNLIGDPDFSTAHARADDLLQQFVRDLGYDDLAEAYEKVGKWYE